VDVLRWRYVLVPLLVLLMAIGVSAYFFGQLPEAVAFRFAPDGTAENVGSRMAVIAAMLVPQFLLVLLAAGVALVVGRVGRRLLKGQQSTPTGTAAIITVMSNMVVLPQLVLLFTMLDIFSYNAFEFHLIQPWIVAAAVMLVGGPILAVFFVKAVQQARQG
jgi:uncharacterized membrane protein